MSFNSHALTASQQRADNNNSSISNSISNSASGSTSIITSAGSRNKVKTPTWLAVASAAALSLAANISVADDHEESFVDELTEPAFGLWSVGVVSRNSPYRDVDTSVAPSLLIFGGYDDIFIEANRFGYGFYRDGTYFASVIGNVRSHLSLSDDDIDDSAALSAYDLDARDTAFEAGVQVGRRFESGWIGRVALLQDVSNAHQGQEAEVIAFRRDPLSLSFLGLDNHELRVLTTVGVQYQSAKLNDYYFGIDSSELANADQQSYRADSGFSAELEVIATYDFNAYDLSWAAYAGFRHFQYDDQVSDSPLTDTGLVQQYFIGLGRTF